MKSFLNKIRTPDKSGSTLNKVLFCLLFIVLGLALGVLQKWLDKQR